MCIKDVTMPEEKQDIFGGRFGEEIKPEKEEVSFSKGASHFFEAFKHLFTGFKHVLLKKIPFNVLLLLLVIAAASFATIYIKPAVTASVVYQNITQECPVCEECICEECPELECPECTEFDCSTCPTDTKFYYICPSGIIVEESSECKAVMPTITSDFVSTADGVTISIDDVDYTFYSDDTGYISKINYTILNQGNKKIKPKIRIKVYEKWTSEVASASPQKTISFKDYLDEEDWIIRSDTMKINFEGSEQTIRLLLQDDSVSPAEDIVAVTRKMDFD